ncbi:unnamed protein product, partial [Prorocentrum cordatum]
RSPARSAGALRAAPAGSWLSCGRLEVRAELMACEWPRGPTRSCPGFRPHVLGFVPNVDEYMSAADILVTKAGPGSIAEAMIMGLPCLLTSFIPGQEEGNIAFVVDGGAGEFVADTDPDAIAEKVAAWLGDPEKLLQMSARARQLGRPGAALDIARRLCDGLMELGTELREGAAASLHTSLDATPSSTRDSPAAATYEWLLCESGNALLLEPVLACCLPILGIGTGSRPATALDLPPRSPRRAAPPSALWAWPARYISGG